MNIYNVVCMICFQDLLEKSTWDQWQMLAIFEAKSKDANSTFTDHLSELVTFAGDVGSSLIWNIYYIQYWVIIRLVDYWQKQYCMLFPFLFSANVFFYLSERLGVLFSDWSLGQWKPVRKCSRCPCQCIFKALPYEGQMKNGYSDLPVIISLFNRFIR